MLDSELLAEVYLAMTRGQESLVIDMLGETSTGGVERAPRVALSSLELPVIVASDEEIAAHQTVLDGLDKAVKGTSVWRLQAVTATDEQTA